MAETYRPKVGAVYDPELVRDWTPEQVLYRDLRDPSYSDAGVGNSIYDWRSDFGFEVENPAVRMRIERFMDHLASTPEGRWHLRQASAMQHQRLANGDFEQKIDETRASIAEHREKYARGESDKPPPSIEQEAAIYAALARPDPSGKIIFSDHPNDNSPEFAPTSGRIEFNSARPLGQYLGTNRQWHDSSFEMVLYHELGHAKDPFTTYVNQPVVDALRALRMPKNLNLPDYVTETKIYSDYFQAIKEAEAIHDTNLVSEPLGLGAPRSLNHSETRKAPAPSEGAAVSPQKAEILAAVGPLTSYGRLVSRDEPDAPLVAKRLSGNIMLG